jgi:rRNA maturation RNase YbeY
MAGVAIKNFTRRPTASRAVFSAIATEVLPGWDISLVFVGATRAKSLNIRLRNKTYVPNVLSYALGKKSGEIFICLSEASKQAPSYSLQPTTFILYLFIHGLLHIKGGVHSVTMERSEKKLLAKFAPGAAPALTYVTQNRNRHRHRHVPSKDGRRRGTLR